MTTKDIYDIVTKISDEEYSHFSATYEKELKYALSKIDTTKTSDFMPYIIAAIYASKSKQETIIARALYEITHYCAD